MALVVTFSLLVPDDGWAADNDAIESRGELAAVVVFVHVVALGMGRVKTLETEVLLELVAVEAVGTVNEKTEPHRDAVDEVNILSERENETAAVGLGVIPHGAFLLLLPGVDFLSTFFPCLGVCIWAGWLFI